MVLAWYLNEDEALINPNADCKTDKLVSLDELQVLGLEFLQIDAEEYATCEKYMDLQQNRGFTYRDCITVSPNTLPNYPEVTKSFYEEHLHKNEELRLVLDGVGYFDVRDKNDVWIRVKLMKNDLLIVPAGIYHRFTLDESEYFKVIRLSKGESNQTTCNRH